MVLDHGDPINRAAILVAPLNEGGGRVVRNAASARGTGVFSQTSGTYPTWTVGRNGCAVAMAGASDYIEYSTVDASDTGGAAALTVCFWLNPASLADFNQFIGAVAGWSDAFNFHTTSTGEVYCGVNTSQRFTPSELAAGTLVAGQWQFFCITMQNNAGVANVAKFYRNGKLLATKNFSVVSTTAWGGFRLGSADTNTINGRVAMVRVLKRALFQSEVMRIYTEPFAGFVQPARAMRSQVTAAATTSTALSTAGAAVGTLATANRISSALAATGAAVGTLATSNRIAADLSATGVAVGTLATGNVSQAAMAATAAVIGTLATQTRIAADLSAAGVAVGTLATPAIVGTAADLSASGTAVGTLATGALVSAAMSATGVALGTLTTANVVSASLSAAGTASGTLSTEEVSADANAYLRWGSQAARRRVLQEDEEEILALLAALAPVPQSQGVRQ